MAPQNLIAELGRHAPASLEVSVASLAPADNGRNDMFGRLTEAGLHPTYLSVRRLLDPRGFLRLISTLRRTPVDVVHAHLGYSATLVPLAARLAGKPVVATLHLSPQHHFRRVEWLKERLSVRIPARLGRVVFVSQHAGVELRARSWPCPLDVADHSQRGRLDRYTVQSGPHSTDRPVWAVVAALRPDKITSA